MYAAAETLGQAEVGEATSLPKERLVACQPKATVLEGIVPPGRLLQHQVCANSNLEHHQHYVEQVASDVYGWLDNPTNILDGAMAKVCAQHPTMFEEAVRASLREEAAANHNGLHTCDLKLLPRSSRLLLAAA